MAYQFVRKLGIYQHSTSIDDHLSHLAQSSSPGAPIYLYETLLTRAELVKLGHLEAALNEEAHGRCHRLFRERSLLKEWPLVNLLIGLGNIDTPRNLTLFSSSTRS